MILSTLLQLADWALFIGRFHPLLVHLPIGILLIAAFLEVGQRLGKLSVTERTKSFILLCAAIGATLSCIAGLLLASGGGYEEEMLSRHRWQGIAVAVFAWLAWMATNDFFAIRLRWIQVLYLPAFALSVLFVFFAGHVGGVLTHGDGYLMQYAPNPLRAMAGLPPREEAGEGGEIKPLENVSQAVVYHDIVQPILTTRCVQCHGKSKQKGKLRLDGYDYVVKGGDGGPGFIVGDGAASAIVSVCLLPIGDDMHMPPKGKPQLTDAQIGLISWWIDQGAPQDKRVAELEQPGEIAIALEALGGGSPEAGGSGSVVARVDLNSIQAPEPDNQVVSELRKLNLIVSPLSKDLNLLEVSAINTPVFSDAQVSLLQKLSEQVAWLKVGNTAITDNGLKEIGGFKNLNKLHLEHTGVSDEGIARLKDMQKLEYLNLIGTKVSDASITALAGLKGLKSLYVWKSAISDEGVAQLRALRPDLQVISGLSEQEVQEFLSAGKKDSLGTGTKAE